MAKGVDLAPGVIQSLWAFERAEWFSQVGRPCAEAAEVVKSWTVVNQICNGNDWENFTLQARNELTSELARRNPVGYNQDWKNVVGVVRPALVLLIEEQQRTKPAWAQLETWAVGQVRWDMLAACMEGHFAPWTTSTFLRRLANWYLRGRFPCGWVGPLDPGRPIVY